MSRPTYESYQNVSEELQIAATFCEVFGCKYEQYPPLHHLNGKFTVGGRTAAVVEIKQRRNKSTTYPTLMISAAKCANGRDWGQKENAPFILLVKFTDGLFMTKATRKYQEAIGGRTDRGDPNDLERCAYIPMEKFYRVA
jgi:hypothetical protein